MSDAYAVMGHPVAHSRSPLIHRLFAEQTGQAMVYTAIEVEPGDFPGAVARFRVGGGRGLNVTLPFKEEAFALAEGTTPRAARAGAVNTLWFEPDGSCRGDNTDGVGLVRDLARVLGAPLAGRRVLMLGAGGAARGVVGPLLEEGPASLVIANRGEERARALATLFSGAGDVRARGLDGIPDRGFDLIVNATSASLHGALPALPRGLLAPGGFAYDLVYGPRPTPFETWARGAGAAGTADGLGMLVEQAAESFLRWRGIRPRTGPILAAVRALLVESKSSP